MVLLAQLTDGYKIVRIKILVTRGKEQEAGHGLTHGLALLAGAVLTARADMPSPKFLLLVILPIPLSFPAPSVTESQRTPEESQNVFP